ncbi:MAG: ROK family protein [Campylobacterota bacterium]
MNLYIDFGGTNFRYQFDNGQIISLGSKTVDLKTFLDDIINKNKQIEFISISFAGQVKDGVIVKSPSIAIENFNIKKYINDTYKIALKIDNDLNCAAIAEHKSTGSKSMALFYIGTGFGGAFLDDGKLVRGVNNQSGEIGHIPFKKTPFVCGCGRDDCIELSVSGSAIKRWCEYYKITSYYHRLDKLHKLNTPESKIIIDNFYDGLAHAFHTAISLFDFSDLVLGGSVGKNKQLKMFLEQEIIKSAFCKNSIKIKLSKLENGSLEGTKKEAK